MTSLLGFAEFRDVGKAFPVYEKSVGCALEVSLEQWFNYLMQELTSCGSTVHELLAV